MTLHRELTSTTLVLSVFRDPTNHWSAEASRGRHHDRELFVQGSCRSERLTEVASGPASPPEAHTKRGGPTEGRPTGACTGNVGGVQLTLVTDENLVLPEETTRGVTGSRVRDVSVAPGGTQEVPLGPRGGMAGWSPSRFRGVRHRSPVEGWPAPDETDESSKKEVTGETKTRAAERRDGSRVLSRNPTVRSWTEDGILGR